MNKYISQVNYQTGWSESILINFESGLNIISGTNGTGKTRLLQFIQSNNGNTNILVSDNTHATTICAFSPQRNAQKMVAQQALQVFRQDLNARENALNIFRGAILDDGFQTIKSISEYFVYLAEETVKSDDIKPSESTAKTKSLFERAIKVVFDFDVSFSINTEARSYDLFFLKNGHNLTPQQLSQGENAIISLICALIFGRESADTFLIDEPEIHLNWSLEEKLFAFLNWFCSEYDKQIISVTHSRVAFLDSFIKKSQFFEKIGPNIQISRKPSNELIRQLAGDTVQLMQGITIKKKLVYVEDTAHFAILSTICEKLKLEAEIVKVGNRENVKTLSKAFKDREIENVYFLLDGDNKPLTDDEKKYLHRNTIQLTKYCIENYLLDVNLLTLYRNDDWNAHLKSAIESLNVRANPAIKPTQISLQYGTSVSEIIDFVDGSVLFKTLAKKENRDNDHYDFMIALVNLVPNEQIFNDFFGELHFLST